MVRTNERDAKSIFRRDSDVGIIQLSQRERDIMRWAAQGKTMNDTAEILNLSADTVERYVKQALSKLGALNKTHGVAKCIALGIINI